MRDRLGRVLSGRAAVSIGLTIWGTTPLGAQVPGTLVGTVIDEITGEGLGGAIVSPLGLDFTAITDTSGNFELAAMPPGDLAVRVEVSGYASIVEQIEVLPDEVVLRRFYVNRLAVAVQGLLVRVQPHSVSGTSVTEVRGGGRSRTALDLLREGVPGVTIGVGVGAVARVRVRASTSLRANDPAIYLDGILLGTGGDLSAVHALEEVQAEDVWRIRVLRGPSASAYYGSARGVILVETR